MLIHHTKFSQAICLLTVGLFVGCSGGAADTPELAQVSGTITLDGAPLSKASVTFQPQSGSSSVGMTDEAGHYELAYNKNTNGAVPGKHSVTISKMGEPGSPNDTEDQVPPQFNRNSKLTAVVKEGENTVNFDLDSKAK
ncbi:carboxypeptidase-like regulatory domain-containing protein [Gimesia maris]|uniref:carboxypeptidase-like regulatory domain-containing protein n=1 Tax=Gimesia maris TaxID=122 RepID=UPI003A95CCA4